MCDFARHSTLYWAWLKDRGSITLWNNLCSTLNLRCSQILMNFELYEPHLHQQLRKHVPCFNSTLAKHSHITRSTQSMYCHILRPSRTCHVLAWTPLLAWTPCKFEHIEPTESAKEISQCMGQKPIKTRFSIYFF